MSRYIDADELRKNVNGVSTHWLNDWSTLGVLAMIDKQPTVDAVPVVRCEKCKHWIRNEDYSYVGRCELWNVDFENDFYCADGERTHG